MQRRLAKRKKLTSWQVRHLLSQGRFSKEGMLLFKFLPSDHIKSRLAVVVSKKVMPKATARNYFKRIQRVLMVKAFQTQQPFDIVVIADKSLYNVSQDSIYEKSEKSWKKFVNKQKA